MSRLSSALIFFLRLSLVLLIALPWSIMHQKVDRVQAAGSALKPQLTAEQAIAVAVNDLRQSLTGYHLRHPNYTIDFTSLGLRLIPQHGGPAWNWQLAEVGGSQGEPPVPPVTVGAVRPEQSGGGRVVYDRGGMVEQYLLKSDHVEQQFILPEPLLPAGSDLVIEGRVNSPGVLETGPDGWLWRTTEGVVSLGQVWVFDAVGQRLPARLEVSTAQTRLVVEGAALARAVYPVTIDPEIGTNDFRISDMGPDGDPAYSASSPAVAYNPTDNEYLVVWEGDDDTSPLADGEFEIYGQHINATNGDKIDPVFRISDMGPDGDPAYSASAPAVVYNPTGNEYLVVWQGDDTTPLPDNPEFEIYGQRIDAETGTEIGIDFRISDMGPDGNHNFDALQPAVVYNSTNNEYLVVWQGDDIPTAIGAEEFEIYGQRLHGNRLLGNEVGTDFRISDMGEDGNHNMDAFTPAVAYNSLNNEYLVVWLGDDDTPPMVDNDFEIYGQRLHGNRLLGNEVGDNDFRLSNTALNGNHETNPNFLNTLTPAVVYNSVNNEYLVVWVGQQNNSGREIFGHRLNATGGQVGPDDFRISDMGPEGTTTFEARNPAVVHNATANQYLVVWRGDDNIPPLVNDEVEIFGQWLAANGTPIGANDFRLSDMGPESDPGFGAFAPAIAYNSTNNQYLVVWSGDDTTDNEFEIYGQRYQPGTEIEVRGNSQIITNGDSTPSLADHTNFGNVTLGQSLTRNFTIINQDLFPLNLTGSPRVSISGPGAGHFSLATVPTSPVGGGSSTLFQIRFNSTVTGTQVATLTIPNNDLNENPYTFVIQATGTNLAPVANAGPNKNVGVGTTGILDGSGSNDPDGHLPLSYLWTQTGGPIVTLSSNTASKPTFPAPSNETTLTFTLRVTDARGLGSLNTDEVVISITREAPVANAGPDQTLGATLPGILDGSGSFDPDGHLPLSYLWTQTGGPTVTFNKTISKPTFTTPNQVTVLTFSLRVTDAIDVPSLLADQVVISITRQAPVAKAGPDQSLQAGATGKLNGSGSFDLDGHLPLSYRWSQVGGLPVVLSSNTISRPTFVAPTTPTVLTFRLTVTDTLGLASAPDQVAITVTPGPVYLPLLLNKK